MLGWAKAAEIIFTGRTLSAAEWLAERLVNQVVPADEVAATARAMALEIAANAPMAVRASKRLMRMGLEEIFETHVQHVYLQRLPLFASDDFREGVTSFLEKRPAAFSGR
jgi:enoyl-CoA hydratase/carnithine racemase